MSCLLLCARAVDLLKSVGFEKALVSMKSEAVYLRYPGRHGLLRVATHKYSGRIGTDSAVACLTFRGPPKDRDSMRCGGQTFDTMVWTAVGQYMLRSALPQVSEYKGKKGTWENKLDVAS